MMKEVLGATNILNGKDNKIGITYIRVDIPMTENGGLAWGLTLGVIAGNMFKDKPESIEAMLKKFDEINKKDKKAKSSAETGNHPNSEKLEKISAELFEYCPENAKYIAINKVGIVFWFSEKPEIDSENLTWKSNGGEGGFVCAGLQQFDASDWEHSLIEKEKN